MNHPNRTFSAWNPSAYRQMVGLTQAEMAVQLGVMQSTISRWEENYARWIDERDIRADGVRVAYERVVAKQNEDL